MEEEEENVEEAEEERKCCGVVESGIHTWTHSVHVPRVYLEGKVELTYWDRSDRLVAFMYPPVSVCRAEMIPLLFLPLPPLFTRHHWRPRPFYILASNTEDDRIEWRILRKWNVSLDLNFFERGLSNVLHSYKKLQGNKQVELNRRRFEDWRFGWTSISNIEIIYGLSNCHRV